MSITKQLKVLSTLAQEGHPAIYTQEYIEHVEKLYRQSTTLRDLPENKKRSLSMRPHRIPLSEYPKAGDMVRCNDDGDIGIVISTRPDPSWPIEEKIMVEVRWNDAGLCVDGWGAESFMTQKSLWEIVSRA